MIKDFIINVSDEQISNINSKIKSYPWSSIEDMEGWTHGTNKNCVNIGSLILIGKNMKN